MSPRQDRRLRLALGLWASAAFVVLWAGAAAHLLGGGHLAGDAWAWLSGLGEPAQFVAWVVLLPVAVALWASQSPLPALVGAAVAIGLVLWTAVAWASLARTLRGGPKP